MRRNFFSQRVVDSWNNIPPVIKDTNTVNSFKRLYGAHRSNVGTAAAANKENKETGENHTEMSVFSMAYCGQRGLHTKYQVSSIGPWQ